MTYTTEEQKTIKNAAKEYAKSLLDDNFSAAFYSSAMKSIIESKIRQGQIDVLNNALNATNVKQSVIKMRDELIKGIRNEHRNNKSRQV